MQRPLLMVLPRFGVATTSRISVLNRPCRTRPPTFLASRAFSLWPSKPTPPAQASELLSDAAVSSDPTPPWTDASIPAAPEKLSDVVEAAVNTLPTETLIPPLQLGDLAAQGLCGMHPAGIYRMCLEYVNVTTGLPWFWTIVATGVAARLISVPFLVRSSQKQAIMQQYHTRLQPLQAASMKAAMAKDTVTAMRLNEEIKAIRSVAGVSQMQLLQGPLVQGVMGIGSFLGIRGMAELPVLQLTQSGVDWLPNLAAVPPSWFSAIFAGMIFVQTRLALLEQPPDMQGRRFLEFIGYGMPLLTVPSMAWFDIPAGCVVSMIAFSAVHIVQSMIVLIPAVRRVLGLNPRGKPLAELSPPVRRRQQSQ
ncbi:hypothetical protein BDZ89DRAFT_1064147 [Hymenopellis radicata]|nr:hypothetical protein BDZ89DRAFT_1064147 [Hymenopellis radicata]